MHYKNMLLPLAAIVLIPVVCSCTVSHPSSRDAWQTGWKNNNVLASPQTDL